jgi:hypothetical protein
VLGVGTFLAASCAAPAALGEVKEQDEMANYIYDANGDSVGFWRERFVFELNGNPVGQLRGTHVHKLSGDYVGELDHGVVVDKHLGSFGSIGHPGHSGNRGVRNYGYPEVFQKLLE